LVTPRFSSPGGLQWAVGPARACGRRAGGAGTEQGDRDVGLPLRSGGPVGVHTRHEIVTSGPGPGCRYPAIVEFLNALPRLRQICIKLPTAGWNCSRPAESLGTESPASDLLASPTSPSSQRPHPPLP
jgi:hypothetical protein